MGFRSVLSCAQQWVAERVRPGDIVVDATVGNGVDTLFLCQTAGPSGLVYGFDVQERAIAQTRHRVEAGETGSKARLARLELFKRSHSEMMNVLPAEVVGRVAAVMFNLGYLPGEASEEPAALPVITQPHTTLPALEGALQLLRPDGIVTVVLYSGHEGGDEEAALVRAWAEQLPQELYQVLSYRFLNAKQEAPYLIGVLRKPHKMPKPRTTTSSIHSNKERILR